MTLIEQITQDIAEAMQAKDAVRLSALRMAKAALMNGEVEKGRALDEAEAQQVLASLIKQRRDSIEQFGERRTAGSRRQGNCRDRRAREATCRRPPAAAELEQAVAAAIAETGATTPKDMGRVMKAVMARSPARASTARRSTSWCRKNCRLNHTQTFSRGVRLIILKGNAQASHPSSMGPPPQGGGLFRLHL